MTAAEVLANWPETAGLVAKPFDRGHINDTYVVGGVAAGVADGERFVLQRVNRYVFANAAGVMRNLEKVAACSDRVVAPLTTSAGKAWATDAAGDLWRLFPYIAGSRSFDKLTDDLIEPAGLAFGDFLAALAHFDGTLEVAIDGFHDLPRYLDALWAVAGEAMPELDYIKQRRAFDFTRDFSRNCTVIHGDCKVNNLLFHPMQSRVTHVVDLDTVMFGHPAWDFGDLVRSIASGGEEALAVLDISVELFETVAIGFARGLGGLSEPAAFAAAPGHMSFMLGVRFLTDHLDGDRYFKVDYPGQNLERARTQLESARRFDALEAELERILMPFIKF